MADDEKDVEVVAEHVLSAEQAREAKQLDAVTDYHEDGEMDTKKAQAAINALSESSTGTSPSAVQHQVEMSRIKVDAADVALIMQELEVSEDAAILALRQNGNDVKKAIREMIKV